MVGEIDQWMSQRGKFPVQYGQNARLGRVKHHVVKAVVAVNNAHLVTRRDVFGQPRHQLIGSVYGFSFCRAVLLAPATDLTLDVVARLAVVAQAHGLWINAVQGNNDTIKLIKMRCPLDWRHAGQAWIPQDAPFETIHDVERSANHFRIFAKRVGARHRHIGERQRADDTKLTIDCVR